MLHAWTEPNTSNRPAVVSPHSAIDTVRRPAGGQRTNEPDSRMGNALQSFVLARGVKGDDVGV